MAKENKKAALSLEDRLDAALVPDWEQPYKVPENWCWTKLDNVAKWGSGGTPSRRNPEYFGGQIPWVKTGELNDDYIYETEETITEEGLKYSSAKLYPTNTIVIAMYGATVGKVGILGVKATTNQACACGMCSPAVNYQYLFYYAQSQKDIFIDLARGGAQPNISQEIIKNHPIPIPPLAEQQRIVDRIESLFAKLDEAKEKAQEVVDGYDARRAAILHKAFTGELTEKWRSVRGVEKDSWLNTDLSHSVLSFKYGTSEKSTYENAGMPVFRIPNVTDLGLSFEDLKYLPRDDIPYESQIHENEILIIRSNGSRDLVGKSVLVPHLDRQYAYASFLIKAVPAKMIDPAFLVYYLNSADARNQMFKKAKSTAGINNINSKELGEITISVPLLQEQAEIVSILDKLLEGEMQAVETAKNAVGKIEQLKKAILARAFRGELGTNDPNDENAIELLKQVLKEVL